MRLILIALLLIATPAYASEVETQQDAVLACLSKMDTDTSWAECRSMLFEPCAEETVGSESHLTCLASEKKAWQGEMDLRRDLLNEKLTTNGSAMMTDLLGQWFGYVANKCQAVADEKAGISSEAAFAGCEISEIAGITLDFETCLKGNSTSPYCIHKE